MVHREAAGSRGVFGLRTTVIASRDAITATYDTPSRDSDSARQNEARQRERLQHGQNLGHKQDSVAIHPVNEYARERRENQCRDLPAKTDDAEQEH